MANEGQMTLDDLAVLISKGFTDLREEINGLRGGMMDLPGEVTGVRDEMDDLKTQAGGLRHEVTGIRLELTRFRTEVERRFDRVERDLAGVGYVMPDVVRRDEFHDLKQRVEAVERHLGLGPQSG